MIRIILSAVKSFGYNAVIVNRHKPNRLLWLAAVGIALQALVPAGYMPAPIAGGLPFVLCPGGLSGAAFFIADESGAHHDGGAHHERAHDHSSDGKGPAPVWEFCPFGAVFGGTALIAEYDSPSPPLEHNNPLAAEADRIVRSAPVRPWRARAPPTDQPIDA